MTLFELIEWDVHKQCPKCSGQLMYAFQTNDIQHSEPHCEWFKLINYYEALEAFVQAARLQTRK